MDDQSLSQVLPEASAAEQGAATEEHVRAYLREIGPVPLLTPMAEQALARAVESGAYVRALRGHLGRESNAEPTARAVLLACYDRLVGYAGLVLVTCAPKGSARTPHWACCSA